MSDALSRKTAALAARAFTRLNVFPDFTLSGATLGLFPAELTCTSDEEQP